MLGFMDKERLMIKIRTTSGMRGSFAVMYDSVTGELINTGLTCKDYEAAKQYAIDWAKADFGDDWKDHCDYRED